MNLRQLEYLDAVAQLGSFSAAARRLHVVQPAVSQQIRKLESELGVDLLSRTNPIRLTPKGEEVVRHARVVLREVGEINAATAVGDRTVSGELTVGAMHWIGHVDVPAALAVFADRHPGVSITLVERTTPEMLKAVRSGDLDVTFVSLRHDEDRPRGIRLTDLGSEQLVVAGRPGSLPEGGGVHLRFLHDRPFVAFAEGSNLRATVDAALEREGIAPRTVLASNEPLTVRDLAAQGLGYALIPAELARAAGAPLGVADLLPPGVHRRLALAWRSDRRPSAPALAFIETVRQVTAA